jgi:hypothetical protein
MLARARTCLPSNPSHDGLREHVLGDEDEDD